MSLVSPLLALIYRARSWGVHIRVQVNFPNPSLLRTAGLRTFLVSRGLLRRCHLVGRGRIFMGLLPSWTPGRLIRRSREVTPSSVAPECLGDSSTFICRLLICTVHPWVAGSLVAMTKPVSRDAKLKGPKESADRALVNCTRANTTVSQSNPRPST